MLDVISLDAYQPHNSQRKFPSPASLIRRMERGQMVCMFWIHRGLMHTALMGWPALWIASLLWHWFPELIISSLIHNIKLFMLNRPFLFPGLSACRFPLWQHYLTTCPTHLLLQLNSSAAASQQQRSDRSEQLWAMDRHFPVKLTLHSLSNDSNVWKQ